MIKGTVFKAAMSCCLSCIEKSKTLVLCFTNPQLKALWELKDIFTKKGRAGSLAVKTSVSWNMRFTINLTSTDLAFIFLQCTLMLVRYPIYWRTETNCLADMVKNFWGSKFRRGWSHSQGEFNCTLKSRTKEPCKTAIKTWHDLMYWILLWKIMARLRLRTFQVGHCSNNWMH